MSKFSPKIVAILGPGAVGGFLSAVLWQRGVKVICVAHEAGVEDITKNGIHLKSRVFGDFIAKPKAVSQLTDKPDILFITSKSIGLTDHLQMIDPDLLKFCVVIPLLNGFDHIEIIRRQYGRNLAVGSISIEVFRPETGVVVHTSPFVKIRIASDSDISEEKLKDISDWLSDFGIEAELVKSESEVIWEKLVRVNALACLTTVTNKPIGWLRSDSFWRQQIERCIKEASAVANTQGVIIDFDSEMARIDGMDPNQLSSLQRDVAQEKPSEVDSIIGAIVKVGLKNNVKCPTIEKLYKEIKTK